MNLQETKLPLFVRRRFSEEDIDELISNVKFSIPKYGDNKNIDDVIYDEVREFMMDKSDFGYHGTLRNDLIGNEYFDQLSKFEEPLRDYVRSVILNTNLQESIRKVLREESDKVMNMQSKILSQFRKQDQMERNEYSKFVQSEFGGDYERGAKEYAKIKNRNSDDIFGDKKRIREFILINFDFNTFSSKDWENYWLLSQHSDNHPEFQKNALNNIKQNLGEDNEYYEYLHDRISCRESGTQIYGTQNICKKSKMNLQESIRRILREEFNQLPKYLYHLTSDENYKNILMEGFLNPKYSKQSKRKKGIYLSDDISVAENYRFFYEPDEKVVLLKIKTSSLNEDSFYPDDYELQDFLNDGGWGVSEDIEYSRWYDVPWQLSLKWVNQIQYLEPIPISEIKKI